MKVELSDICLAVTGVLENVVVGIPDKDKRSFKHQHDVTGFFIKAVMEKFGPNAVTKIKGGGKVYEITVREIDV